MLAGERGSDSCTCETVAYPWYPSKDCTQEAYGDDGDGDTQHLTENCHKGVHGNLANNHRKRSSLEQPTG